MRVKSATAAGSLLFCVASCAERPEILGAPGAVSCTREHEIALFDPSLQRDRPVVVTDSLSVSVDEAGRASFFVGLVHTNAHVCELGGLASSVEGGLVYRDSVDGQPGDTCVLTIETTSSGFVLGDPTGACRTTYCGARGFFDSIYFARDGCTS